MPRLPIYEGDFSEYDGLPQGAPIARCPNKVSKISSTALQATMSSSRPNLHMDRPISVNPAEDVSTFIETGNEDLSVQVDLKYS